MNSEDAVNDDSSSSKKRQVSEWIADFSSDLRRPPSKKSKRDADHTAFILLRRCIHICCRDNDLATAIEAYEEAIEKEIKLEAKTFYALLNLCDGLDDRRVHVGTPKSVTSQATNKERSLCIQYKHLNMYVHIIFYI